MTTIVLEITFWTCIGAIAYNYAGYPVVLFLLATLSQVRSDISFVLGRQTRRTIRPASDRVPTVAVLLSAYNEEAVIGSKVENFLALDYPHDKLELLIGLDSPTDLTPEILSRVHSPRIRIFSFSKRQGKLAVLCALAQQTSAEIVVTTDANTMMDTSCIRTLVRHFGDPRVGAASGEETRITALGTDPAAESLYWRYESGLKFLENRLNCCLGGNGSVLAVRRSLFHLEKPSIVEDFQLPLDILFKGYRVVYDPEAIVVEELPPTLSAQFSRRIRLGAGAFQTLFGNLACLNPAKGLRAFCYFSHRGLRWLTPLLLIVAFACSAALLMVHLFAILLSLQVVFYMAALVGYRLKRQGKRTALLALPLHFCSMNLALFLGFVQYVRGRQSLAWKATPRTAQGEQPSHS